MREMVRIFCSCRNIVMGSEAGRQYKSCKKRKRVTYSPQEYLKVPSSWPSLLFALFFKLVITVCHHRGKTEAGGAPCLFISLSLQKRGLEMSMCVQRSLSVIHWKIGFSWQDKMAPLIFRLCGPLCSLPLLLWMYHYYFFYWTGWLFNKVQKRILYMDFFGAFTILTSLDSRSTTCLRILFVKNVEAFLCWLRTWRIIYPCSIYHKSSKHDNLSQNILMGRWCICLSKVQKLLIFSKYCPWNSRSAPVHRSNKPTRTYLQL